MFFTGVSLVSTTETASHPNNPTSRKLNVELDQQLRGFTLLPRHIKQIRVWIEKKILASFSSIPGYYLGASFLVVVKTFYSFTHSSNSGLKRSAHPNGKEDERERF